MAAARLAGCGDFRLGPGASTLDLSSTRGCGFGRKPTALPAPDELRTGWSARLTRGALAALLFLLLSGLLITLAPFHAAVPWNLLLHSVVGLLSLVLIAWYTWSHWLDYRRYNLTDVVLLGYLAAAALAVCLVSGGVVTYQGLFATRMSPVWRNVHLYSTWALLVLSLPHFLLVFFRIRKKISGHFARPVIASATVCTLVGLALALGLAPISTPGPPTTTPSPRTIAPCTARTGRSRPAWP